MYFSFGEILLKQTMNQKEAKLHLVPSALATIGIAAISVKVTSKAFEIRRFPGGFQVP